MATQPGLLAPERVRTQIEEVIALQPVTIFSKTSCGFSTMAKEALSKAGVSKCATVELDRLQPQVSEAIQNHLAALTGARTVPRVFIDRKFIGGGQETAQLAASGELKKLVDSAMAQHHRELRGEGEFRLRKDESEWRKELGTELYGILRDRGTERPGSHAYDQFYPETGHFACRACGLALYSAKSKFRSSCGWPVFDSCYHSEDLGCHVGTRNDGSGSLEIICPNCGSHLGHVFFDAHSADNPNGERH